MNANRNLSMQQWQEETALERFQIIAPLQDEGLDPAKRILLRREIAGRNGLSEKTVKRYDDAYQKGGFEGLKPKSRSPHNPSSLPDNFEEIVREAVQLRREVPSRSVDKIITILELEGRVAPGILKLSEQEQMLQRQECVEGDRLYGRLPGETLQRLAASRRPGRRDKGRNQRAVSF